MAEILQNAGWQDAEKLSAIVSTWRETFRAAGAERLVLDFAPNALLAGVASGLLADVVGTGFYIPPALSPLPPFRHDYGVYPERLRWSEEEVLSAVSKILNQSIAGLMDVFHADGVRNHLVTYSEFDHYPARENGHYCGIVTPHAGGRATWSGFPGPRVFAYLRPFPGLPFLLQSMRALGAHIQVHGNAKVAETVERMALEGISYTEKPVDERTISGSDAVMVNHAGHDGTIKAALAGATLLQLPLTIEQSLTAQNAANIGVSEWMAAEQDEDFVHALARLFEQNPGRREAARLWAESKRPASLNLERLIERLTG